MNVGIIGAGGIAEAHLYAYSRIPERAAVVALADVDTERARRLAAKFGLEADVVADYRQLLTRDDVHAVSVCTPPFVHAEISAAALRAGKHVLCEKPVAATLAELDSIEAAQRESGSVFSGVFQWRFGRGAKQVRWLIDNGKFGNLHLGLAETLWFRDHPYYDDVAWRGTWAQEAGGVTVSQAIHAIDCLLWFLGEPVSVYAQAGAFRARIEADDTAVAVIRFASGAIGQITSTVNARHKESTRIELFGSELSAIGGGEAYDTTKDLFALGGPDAETLAAEAEAAIGKAPNMLHRGAVGDFLDAIENKRTPLADIATCRTALRTTAAIYKSAMSGEVVRLPLTREDPWYGALPPLGFALV
ncbi:MAG: Gfo/Idh/MocA family oxidoreductase [Chloroflexota bacterium]